MKVQGGCHCKSFTPFTQSCVNTTCASTNWQSIAAVIAGSCLQYTSISTTSTASSTRTSSPISASSTTTSTIACITQTTPPPNASTTTWPYGANTTVTGNSCPSLVFISGSNKVEREVAIGMSTGMLLAIMYGMAVSW